MENKFLYEVTYVEYDKNGATEHKKYFVAPDFSNVVTRIDGLITDTNYDIISINKVVKIDEVLEF